MTTLRTTARLTLAVLTFGLGAALAPAADNKPIVGPVVLKPNGFSWGEWIPPTAAKSGTPAVGVRKPNGYSWGLAQTVVKQREAGSGLPTGRTKPANLGDTGTHEVGHLKGVKRR